MFFRSKRSAEASRLVQTSPLTDYQKRRHIYIYLSINMQNLTLTSCIVKNTGGQLPYYLFYFLNLLFNSCNFIFYTFIFYIEKIVHNWLIDRNDLKINNLPSSDALLTADCQAITKAAIHKPNRKYSGKFCKGLQRKPTLQLFRNYIH